jgi:predicted ATPase
MEKIVLTGGPGSGKSSIILGLEEIGEAVIREAAEDFIKLKQAQGIREPWLQPGFQEGILRLQLQREARIPNEAQRAFLDRGIADGLAYTDPNSETYQRVLSAVPAYNRIFLVENLGSTETNQVRRENYQEALEIERKLEEVYKTLGYEPIKIGPGTVQERIATILKTLR